MFFRKKDLYVDKLAESVKPKDPLYQFKKATRGELGRYSVEGEVWKAVRKLALLALLLLWSRRNSLYKNIGMKVDESVGRVESYTAKNPALVPVDDGRPRPPLLCYRLPGAQEPKTLELDQTLLIGKGAVCLPQLPPSVQGVDPVHCRLRWKDGVTTLEDLGSQTGTFLENGEQLAPFSPAVLPEGQGFTAGSFRFELLPPPPKEA